MNDDPEEALEEIHKQVGAWFDEFTGSPEYQGLTNVEKDRSGEVIRIFTEYSYTYVGVEPGDWKKKTVEECCLDVFPRKTSAGAEFFRAVAPVLSAFFAFLGAKGHLSRGAELSAFVAGLGEDIVASSEDQSSWGPAKSLIMGAIKAGVNPADERALKQYMLEYNQRLLARHGPLPPVPVAPPPMMSEEPPSPVRRDHPKIGRNDPCPCGSGKKFKKCCGG